MSTPPVSVMNDPNPNTKDQDVQNESNGGPTVDNAIIRKVPAPASNIVELQPDDDDCHLENLPTELLDMIVQMLPHQEKLKLRSVSKCLNNVVSSSSRLKFHPILSTKTLDTCKGFLSEPTDNFFWKYYNYDELTVGSLRGADCSWLATSNLEQIEMIRFTEQITSTSLRSIRLLLQNSINLRQLDFKKYNFHHFRLGQLNKAGGLNETFQNVTQLSIKGEMLQYFINPEDPLGAKLEFATFSCKDLTNFTSLVHLKLLTMGDVKLKNVSSLPISLKNLHLFTLPLQRSHLKILVTHLLNLERLVLQSFLLRDGLSIAEGIADEDIPLDKDIFETVVHRTSIKFLQYLPISKSAADGRVSSTMASLQGSNIVVKAFVGKDTLMVKIKREV